MELVQVELQQLAGEGAHDHLPHRLPGMLHHCLSRVFCVSVAVTGELVRVPLAARLPWTMPPRGVESFALSDGKAPTCPHNCSQSAATPAAVACSSAALRPQPPGACVAASMPLNPTLYQSPRYPEVTFHFMEPPHAGVCGTNLEVERFSRLLVAVQLNWSCRTV